MTTPHREPTSKPLDEEAKEYLDFKLHWFRESIENRAATISQGNLIDSDSVARALSELAVAKPRGLLDAQQVIDQAMEENRGVLRLTIAMSTTLFLVGILSILAGIIGSMTSAGPALVTSSFVAGSILEVLLVIPLRIVWETRRHNLAIRMQGFLLDRVEDPRKIAPLLRETFGIAIFGKDWEK